MKKTLLILLAIVLAFAMVACSKDDNNNNDNIGGDIIDNNPDNGDDNEEFEDIIGNVDDNDANVDNDEDADNNGDDELPADSLGAMLLKVIDGVVPEEMWTETAEITDETFQNFFFIEPIEGYEAWVNVAGMSSIAHEISLLRVSEGTDVEALAKQIEDSLNPRKWVCVEAEKTAVVVKDNIILVTMSRTEIVDGAVANFKAL